MTGGTHYRHRRRLRSFSITFPHFLSFSITFPRSKQISLQPITTPPFPLPNQKTPETIQPKIATQNDAKTPSMKEAPVEVRLVPQNKQKVSTICVRGP
ncbi:hypothetical protein QYF36_003736 [Acer negundo]|nr:hypothetical protein QYF36_003736 [Acer negundo]